jgi:hypothetical protein
VPRPEPDDRAWQARVGGDQSVTSPRLGTTVSPVSSHAPTPDVAGAFAPDNSVAVLLAATQRVTVSQGVPLVLADAGVENVNAQIDALLATGALWRLLAMTELKFSNWMIEAWWRSLKHQWLFLHALDSVATVHRLVEFYVDEHNRVLPHAAFRGQTSDEMYSGAGDAVPAELAARADAARRARLQANRSMTCERCSALVAAM